MTPWLDDSMTRSQTKPRAMIDGLIVLGLLVLTFALYARVAHFDFINYDDGDYVAQNRVVRQGLTLDGVAWAFTTGHAANWHPLTWLSHMLDVSLFGVDSPRAAGKHHLVNVALHATNSVLLFVFLLRATTARWTSAFIACVFATHPLHVESVAWISERKDVLSGM